MPKIINYADRIDCIREAVFTIVARSGPAAVTPGSVAAELNMSLSSVRRSLSSSEHLPLLGFQWIERLQRSRIFVPAPAAVQGPEPWKRALNALLLMVPQDEASATAEAVWHRLVTTYADSQSWAWEARAERTVNLNELADEVVARVPLSPIEHRHQVDRLCALVEGVTERVRLGALAVPDAATLVKRCAGVTERDEAADPAA